MPVSVRKSRGSPHLEFAASALKAIGPTKALGEEYFVVHALADSSITQSQIAPAHPEVNAVQVNYAADAEVITP